MMQRTLIVILCCSCGDQGGVVLPLPDMKKVTFSQESGLGQFLVSGEEGAVKGGATVRVLNQRTSTFDETEATANGSFGLTLGQAEIGDTVEVVTIVGDGSRSALLELSYVGEQPPAPMEVSYLYVDAENIELRGFFVEDPREIILRYGSFDSGLVREAETFPGEVDSRVFEAPFAASVGETLWLHGLDPERTAPGPFVRIELVD